MLWAWRQIAIVPFSIIEKTNHDKTAVATSTQTIAHIHEGPSQLIPHESKAPPQQQFHLYWQSTKASKIFLPLSTKEDSLVVVNAQIALLSEAIGSPLGLVHVLEDGEEIDLESISNYQMFHLRQKVTMLHIALNVAVRDMSSNQNWAACCSKAIEIANETIGLVEIKDKRTIRNWYCQFPEKTKFTMRIGSTNDCLPPFLQDNIDSVQKMKDYARSNLNKLSIEMISWFIHNKVIPAIVKDKYNVKK